jgi:hypothetical protein
MAVYSSVSIPGGALKQRASRDADIDEQVEIRTAVWLLKAPQRSVRTKQ